jgi:phage tail-like protein
LAIAEYRDGLTLYTYKQPGLPTVGNCTLGQGTTTNKSDFFSWIKDATEGNEYRADLEINVYDNSPQAKNNVVKVINLYDAFPIRDKIFGDLDSTNADVNVRELELAVEQVAESL